MPLIWNKIEIVGGLVGDSIDAIGEKITEGIVGGFKVIIGTSTFIVEKLSELCIYGTFFMYFASKDSKLKGTFVKYSIIYGGALYVEKIVSLL